MKIVPDVPMEILNAPSPTVPRARRNDRRLRYAEFLRDLRQHGADGGGRREKARHLRLPQAADAQHLRRPRAAPDVVEEHPGRIRRIGAVHAREPIVDIVLGQHDLIDACEELRLVFFHPQELWRRKARKGNIRRTRAERLPADSLVQIVDLIRCAPVVPENRGAYHAIRRVEHDKAVHLAARADACHLRAVMSAEKRRDSLLHRLPPCRGILFAPAGLRKVERIAAGHNVFNIAHLVRQEQLARGRAEIDADVKHFITSPVAALTISPTDCRCQTQPPRGAPAP